uniref:Ribosomal protein S11 n=1 Tax=Balbiania investiens TaxID=111861 RepID=A0A4D6BP51_9FLOR
MQKVGVIFILFTSNNVIYSLTDLKGSVLLWTSTGTQRTKGLKKSMPLTIYTSMLAIAKKSYELGFLKVHLKIKGFNKNKKSIVKALNHSSLTALSLQDLTSFPHNGCRVAKCRRI